MALKPGFEITRYDISRFFGTVANLTNSFAERGGVVSATGTMGSGEAMDQSVHQVWYRGNPSGAKAVGLLLSDVRNLDLTRQILNPNKSEHQVGDKVPLCTEGWVVTNLIDTASTTITAQAVAYLAGSGYITARSRTGIPTVGRFLAGKDQNGYAKVFIDL